MSTNRTAQGYYHGTWAGYGDAIMRRGFELGHEGHDHLLGRGLYVARELASAALWTADFVILVRLQPGTRILWLDDDYDRNVINSLRREFGRELLDLGPHFYQVIPANKQLTQRELIHLCHYTLIRANRARQSKVERYRGAWQRLSRLHEQVKHHGYDAVGDRSAADWDSDEILVFNPARVIPISAHRLIRRGREDKERYSLSAALAMDDLPAIAAQAQAEADAEDAAG